MEEILNFKRPARSSEELEFEVSPGTELSEQDLVRLADEQLLRSRNLLSVQRQLRSEMFQKLRDTGVHVSVSREDVRKQLQILRRAGGKTPDDRTVRSQEVSGSDEPGESQTGQGPLDTTDHIDAPFIDFDDYVYQLDVLQQSVPPYEVLYSGMDLKPVPTNSGLVYQHRDGSGLICVTPNGDVCLLPNEALDDPVARRTQTCQKKGQCPKDRYKELYDKYMTGKLQTPSLDVQFDKNVCRDSVQTTDSFVLRLLMNNYSEIDLLSVMQRWLLCPLQKLINDIVDQWNAVAEFLMKIFVPIFNLHVHTTPVGPTSPPQPNVESLGEIPKWYKLPHACFVEEFAYKIEQMKRDKLCVQPFLNKTYTCGDGRQICQFLSKYSDALAYEIIGQHTDDPNVRKMRNSGQWKKFAMYSPQEANFVLLKVKELGQPVVPLDAATFDKLKFVIQPVLNIPDDVFLFCGGFANELLQDIAKLLDYQDTVAEVRDSVRSFYAQCRAGNVRAQDVLTVQSSTRNALKKGYICQQDLDSFIDFVKESQAQPASDFQEMVKQLQLQLRTGQAQNAEIIQSRLNASFLTGSMRVLDQVLQRFGQNRSPVCNSFNKFVSKVQQLFGTSVSVLTNNATKLTYDQLKNVQNFIHIYRQTKRQLYPLNGSGTVDQDVLRQVQASAGSGCGCPKVKGN